MSNKSVSVFIAKQEQKSYKCKCKYYILTIYFSYRNCLLCKMYTIYCILKKLSFIYLLSAASQKGISLLHGNSSAFYVIFEEVFRVIYQYFLNLELGVHELTNIVNELRKLVLEVKVNTKDLKGKEDISPCSKVRNIEDILLKRIKTRIREVALNKHIS